MNPSWISFSHCSTLSVVGSMEALRNDWSRFSDGGRALAASGTRRTIQGRSRRLARVSWGSEIATGLSFGQSAKLVLESGRVRGESRTRQVCVNVTAARSEMEAGAFVEEREEVCSSDFRNGDDFGETGEGQEVNSWDIERDNEILRMIQSSEEFYPIVRTYRNDLCTLELCGCAKRLEALTALASDRSYEAVTNLLMRRPLTVIQTVLPGGLDNHSTISTKLFAPSNLVVERAKKLTMPDGVASKDYMHRLFEAVQMRELSKFYVEFHALGTERTMSSLAIEEKASTIASLESSDKKVLDDLAKAVSLYAVSCINKNRTGDTFVSHSWKIWQRSQWVPSSGASVRICTLSETEILTQVRNLLEFMPLGETPKSEEADVQETWWPAPVSSKKVIKKYLGNCMEGLAHDYLPIHKLQIDLSLLDVKVTGGHQIAGQTWELLLSHSQMVDLAGVLDMFYEDIFSLPNKRINTGALLGFCNVSRSKISKSLQAANLIGLVAGAFFFAWLLASRFRRINFSDDMQVNLFRANSATVTDQSNHSKMLSESLPEMPYNQQISTEERETLCRLVVGKVMKAFGWPGQIQSNSEKGSWMGQETFLLNGLEAERCNMEGSAQDKHLLESLRINSGGDIIDLEAELQDGVVLSNHKKMLSDLEAVRYTIKESAQDRNFLESVKLNSEANIDLETKLQDADRTSSLIGKDSAYPSAIDQVNKQVCLERMQETVGAKQPENIQRQNLLLYQVVLSRNGDVVGFLPLNQAAVMQWACMPFAEELYKGHRLGPGFFEQSLKYVGPPSETVAIELYILNDPNCPSIYARCSQM